MPMTDVSLMPSSMLTGKAARRESSRGVVVVYM